MKKLLLFLFALLLAAAAVVLIKTFSFSSKQIKTEPVKHFEIGDDAIERFAQSLRIATISWQDSAKFDSTVFIALQQHLRASFPLVDSLLERKVINKYSLLYTWQGTDASLKPALFMAHQDVVPIDPLSISDWRYPPFEGKIDSGFVFGRGAIDVKCQVMGLLEAAEILLKQGFQPKRTILFAFGHDEEIGGAHGAKEIAKYLRDTNIHPEFIMDEGGTILHGTVPGVPESTPVALIGIAEKGYVSFELTVEEKGGHSSMPPKHTAIGILSSAIARIEKHPYPNELGGAGAEIFNYVGPEMNFPLKMVFANRWLFSPLIKRQLDAGNSTRATMHTTTAVTVIQGGEKENVLPVKAKALVNFRLMPGNSSADALRHLEKIIDDPRVNIAFANEQDVYEASPVSDAGDKNFKILQTTISQIFPDAIVTPYLVLGSTDTKHYVGLTPNIYRFQPIRIHDSDLKRIHGTDERLSIASYKESVNFFLQLMKNVAE